MFQEDAEPSQHGDVAARYEALEANVLDLEETCLAYLHSSTQYNQFRLEAEDSGMGMLGYDKNLLDRWMLALVRNLQHYSSPVFLPRLKGRAKRLVNESELMKGLLDNTNNQVLLTQMQMMQLGQRAAHCKWMVTQLERYLPPLLLD